MEDIIVNQKKPLDYLKILFRRKWLIILPTLAGTILSIFAANMLPKVYESSTYVLVEEGRVLNPLIQGLAVSTSIGQRLSLLREQILGWDRINQLIAKLQLDKDVKNQRDFEKLVYRLRRQIRVTLRGPNIIGISYHGEHPQECMNIVKTITDIFIAENLKQQTSETDNAINFINDQLVLYKKKLKQSAISEMEEKLRMLLLDSTEKHPMVIDLREKIKAAKDEMESGNFDIDKKMIDNSQDSEIKGLKEELKEIKKELSTSNLDADKGGANRAKIATATNDKLYKLLLMDKIEKVTAEDANVNEKLYNELLQRLETAKLTQRLEASKDGTKYVILDPARLPLDPIKPNKIYVLIIGTVLGMCAGLGLVFMVEMLDRSFIDVEEARQYLELPILGAVSKIITERDIKAQKVRKIKITMLSIITGGILILVIFFNIILGG